VSLKSMEYWVLVQMFLEVGLIALVLVSLWKIRSWYQSIMALQAERPTREEIAKMAELSALMEERRQNLEELITLIDQKAAALQALSRVGAKATTPAEASPPWESGPSLRSQVESLYREGCSSEEIARRLQLNLAEVKMALDLSRARPR
jgi:hypothetical protein